MWKRTLELDRPEMTIRHMRFACWIPQAANTLSEYVILIDFPLQQWLHEFASMLHYTYTVSLVYSPFHSLPSISLSHTDIHTVYSPHWKQKTAQSDAM